MIDLTVHKKYILLTAVLIVVAGYVLINYVRSLDNNLKTAQHEVEYLTQRNDYLSQSLRDYQDLSVTMSDVLLLMERPKSKAKNKVIDSAIEIIGIKGRTLYERSDVKVKQSKKEIIRWFQQYDSAISAENKSVFNKIGLK